MGYDHKGRLERLLSMSPSFAVLDGDGVILAVSDSWRRFGASAGQKLRNFGVGCAYQDYCETEPRLKAKLRQLLDGEVQSILYLYPCPKPDGEGWFVVLGLPQTRRSNAGRRVTLFHIEVTELLSTSMSPLGQAILLSFDHAIEIPESDILVAILRQAILEAFGGFQPEADHWSQLSPRELEIAQLIAQNYSNKEISDALLCSVNTVKRHITSIMKKLRVLDRQEVAKWWAQRP